MSRQNRNRNRPPKPEGMGTLSEAAWYACHTRRPRWTMQCPPWLWNKFWRLLRRGLRQVRSDSYGRDWWATRGRLQLNRMRRCKFQLSDVELMWGALKAGQVAGRGAFEMYAIEVVEAPQWPMLSADWDKVPR